MMKKNFVKKSSAVVCVALLAASMTMTGCSSKTKTTDDVTISGEATPEAVSSDVVSSDATVKETSAADTQTADATAEKSDGVFGQITAIDGDKITIALANQPTAPSGDKPSGDKPSSDKPSGDKSSGDKPSGDKPSGTMNLDLTGETKDITVSDTTEITVDGKTGTVDDLKKEDVVTVKMNGDNVVSISVGMGDKGGAPDGTASSDTSSETDSTGK